jgi:hypothetical protein
VKDFETQSAVSIRPAGRGRSTLLGAVVAAAVALTAFCLAQVFASSAEAAEHTTITGEYGKEGPSASGIGTGCSMAWHGSTNRLYLFSDDKVYGLTKTAPGSVTPVGGAFPFSTGVNASCGDRDLAVDNSPTGTNGRIYFVPSSTFIHAFTSTGSTVGSPWPVNVGGETCGVSVDSEGNVWGGVFSAGGSAKRYSSAGSPLISVTTGFQICKLQINPANNDLFAAEYGTQLVKFTAASGYMTKVSFPNTSGSSNPGLAINGALSRIYVAAGTTVKAYDTNTAALVETITPGGTVLDVAVDEATDSLFITTTSGGTGVIKEYSGIKTPKATTGEPIGNTEVSGTADPNEVGPITECYFEFGPTASYGSQQPCAQSVPFNSVQAVSADLPGLVGEQTYHYRLVLGTGAPGVIGKGADKTIVPHYVEALLTDPAENVTRTTALLKAHFDGNGEETKYFFEWGTDTTYGNQSAAPPGTSAGSPTGLTPLSFEATGLDYDTLYHFRVVASNGQGTSNGNDRTFKTPTAVAGLQTDAATNIKPKSADLNASYIGTGEDTEYFFEWGSSAAYGHSTPIKTANASVGPTSITPESISGLVDRHLYHYRVVAMNAVGTTIGLDETFETVSAPSIVGLSSSGVLADSANLHAVINPHGEDTSYHFEYGTTTDYGSIAPIPDAVIPAGESDVGVTIHIDGLKGVLYHFRVVASSVNGETISGNQTFNFYPEPCPNETVRQQTGSSHLPDCRAYEIASPEDGGNAELFPAFAPFSSRATSPSRVAFTVNFGIIDGAGLPAVKAGDLYVATRTSAGWKTRYIGLPSTDALYMGGPPWLGGGYVLFMDTIQTNVLSDPSMSRIVSWDNGYWPCEPEPGICPITGAGEGVSSSNAPYIWAANSGDELARWPTNMEDVEDGETAVQRTAVSADLSHFVFTSQTRPFATGGLPGDLYDNDTVNETIEIVSRDESGVPIQVAPVELSEDGSHILMTDVDAGRCGESMTCGPGRLYMRVDGETHHIASGEDVSYVDMTADGSKVYFTSNEQIVAEDTDTSTDLYLWDENSASPGHLILVSVGNDPSAGNTNACSASWTTNCGIRTIRFTGFSFPLSNSRAGEGGNPLSDSAIASEDGTIYFLSPEPLSGSNGVPGQENLFVYRNGQLELVTVLEAGARTCIAGTFSGENLCSEFAVGRMNVSSDGSHMAFLTDSRVTGYDNQGHSEIYLYTPATGDLVCTSCRPGGEAPTVDVRGSHNGLFMTDDGRTFFSTEDPLVVQDTNQTDDVYEFVGGRPQLISSGTGAPNETESIVTIYAKPGLIGVSADGTDVYFATYDTLVGQDRNGETLKIYDARTGGGFPFVSPPPGCAAADECHGPSSFAPPSTKNGTGADLGAAGNLRSVGKKKTKAKRKKRHQRGKRRQHHKKTNSGRGR